MKKLKLFGTRLITSTYPRTPNVVTLKEGDKISDINFVEGDLLDADSVKIMAAQAATDIEAIITYSELKALRDAGELVPGLQYRITDYVTTTAQDRTQSAGHAFDVIVTADSADKLNESARAIQHAGDTYFANSKLGAWELKYCLDNDTNRFAWADATNGKGVIYYMKDEFNNECPYDFKNIQYVFEKRFDATQYGVINSFFRYSSNDTTISGTTYYGFKRINNPSGPPPMNLYVYTRTLLLTTSMTLYTISGAAVNTYSFSGNIEQVYNDEFNTFTFDISHYKDASIEGLANGVYNNIIKEFVNNSELTLNKIYFSGLSGSNQLNCHNNTFGSGCHDNTLGHSCTHNTFGRSCRNNTFANNCYYNTFGQGCNDNIFEQYCDYNIFEQYCGYNTFGEGCNDNTFGLACAYNTFAKNCDYNTFANNCNHNIFGLLCQNNIFEKYCGYNTFGYGCNDNDIASNCNNIVFEKNYTQCVIVENSNKLITLTSTQTTSFSNKLQNIKIAQGVNNTNTAKTISHDTVNDTFQTIYQPTNSQTISV